LSVGGVAGVEVGGVGFDDEDEGGGIVSGTGAGKQERGEKKDEKITQRQSGGVEEEGVGLLDLWS
jgi:hypothetical protein